MELSLKVNDREIRKFLRKMPKQVPFAMSKALNDTAFEIRNDTVKRVWPNYVDVRKRGFAGRAFRVIKANKRRLAAAVFADPGRVDPKGIKAINQLEEGLTNYPFGEFFAVPTRNAKTRTGRLNAAAKRSLDRGNPDAFVADLGGRGPAIWLRTRRGLKLMFNLRRSTRTPCKFPFRREAERTAARGWDRNLKKAIRFAERTARR